MKSSPELKKLALDVRGYFDIRICPQGKPQETVAVMGNWRDDEREELMHYANLFVTAPLGYELAQTVLAFQPDTLHVITDEVLSKAREIVNRVEGKE